MIYFRDAIGERPSWVTLSTFLLPETPSCRCRYIAARSTSSQWELLLVRGGPMGRTTHPGRAWPRSRSATRTRSRCRRRLRQAFAREDKPIIETWPTRVRQPSPGPQPTAWSPEPRSGLANSHQPCSTCSSGVPCESVRGSEPPRLRKSLNQLILRVGRKSLAQDDRNIEHETLRIDRGAVRRADGNKMIPPPEGRDCGGRSALTRATWLDSPEGHRPARRSRRRYYAVVDSASGS
jgi:hypothetical protein